MPYQQSYPVSQVADIYTNVTGYRTDPVSGKLTTVSVPVPFLYGGKWTMGVGQPTVNGIGSGDSYLNVQNGDVYSWNSTTQSWGTPVGTLINGSYQVPVWIAGKPLSNEILYSLEAPSIFVANAGMTDSIASADNAATVTTVFSLQHNGVQFGTVTFAAGSTVGVIACPAQMIFVVGDVMNVVAPTTVDATLSNIRMTLVFSRPSGAAESDIISSGQAAASAAAALASQNAAATSATNAGVSATLSQNWASQASGTVDGTSYSSKYYSGLSAASATTAGTQAGTATTQATAASASATLAQAWASQASGVVNGTTFFSAANYAGQASTSAGTASTQATAAAASATLAQAWASQTSGVVNGSAYNSAYYYATQAAASATSAANSAASFPTTGRLIATRVFTTSGTYTPTAGTNSIEVELQGAGAGSAGLPANSGTQAACSGSGATGGFVKHRYTSGFSGLTYTVGAGGAAGTSSGGNGGNGGDTTFGALTAGGGQGGTYTQTTNVGTSGSGFAGTATGGNIENIPGYRSVAAAFFIISQGFLLATPACPSTRFGLAYGWGGSGITTGGSSAGLAGNAGGPGVIVVYEYS